MKIALDYDETFTEDKELWKSFIYHAIQRGHEVKFVTYRFDLGDSDNWDIKNDAYDLGIKVIFTEGKQKSNFYDADIWIDDSPEVIPSAKDMAGMVYGCFTNEDLG